MKKLLSLGLFFALVFTIAACDVEVETSLEVDETTIADPFYVDDFDLGDIVLTYYENDEATTLTLDEDMLVGDVPDTVGTHTLEVEYADASTSFDIELIEGPYEQQWSQFKYRYEDEEITILEIMDFGFMDVEVPSEIDGYPVVEIASGAFAEHGFTHTVYIPESVDYIGADAFTATPSLSSIVFEGDIPTFYAPGEDNASFAGLADTLLFYAEDDYLSTLTDSLGDYAHRGFDVEDRGDVFFLFFETFEGSDIDYVIEYAGEEITEPEDPTLDGYVFEGWFTSEDYDTFFDLEMPEANTTIFAGWYDENLEFDTRTMTINEGEEDEEEITYVAITGYDGTITELTLPHRLYTNPVTEIDANAFEDMTDLEYVNIPAYVEHIGSGAFAGSGLETAVLNQADPEAIVPEDDTVFENVHEDFELIVPEGAGPAYRENDAWLDAVGYENIWGEDELELDASEVATVFDAEEGAFVHIEGVVTSFPVFGGNEGFFIQDEDGTAVFIWEDFDVEIGNKVSITGYVDFRTQHQDGNTIYQLVNPTLIDNDEETHDVYVIDDMDIEDVADDFQSYQSMRFWFEDVTVDYVEEEHNYVMLETGDAEYGIRYDIRNYGPELEETYFEEGDTIDWIELTISHISFGDIVAEYVEGEDFVELDTSISTD